MKLQEILEELIMRSAFEKGMNKDYIAQAKIKIEELFGEWVGEDKEIPKGDTTRYIGSPLLVGYNQAKQEIRNRVEEGMK